MTRIERLLGGAATMACAFGLAACSGEPSASDVKDAANRNPKFRMTVAMVANMGGRGGSDARTEEMLKGAAVEKASCVQSQGAPGYVCDFRWGAPKPGGGHQFGSPVKGRFYKSGGDWNVDF